MNFIDIAAPYVEHYGFWSVFLIVFLESMGFPLPGETFIIVASLCAAKGLLSPVGLIITATLATFIANNVSYSLGYWGGRRFISKYGKYIFISDKILHKAEQFIKQHGILIIIPARFVIGLRQLNGLIIGTVRISWLRYAVLNFVGAILWVVFWVTIPYYLGKNFSIDFKFSVFLGAGLLLFTLLLFYFFNKQKLS